MMQCKWCGKEIEGWYLRYDDNVFCRRLDDLCLKNYLFDRADGDIEMGYHETEEEYKFHEENRKAEY